MTARIWNRSPASHDAHVTLATPACHARSEETADGYDDGTYTSSGMGMGGNMPVAVVIEGGKIAVVEIGENSETRGIGSVIENSRQDSGSPCAALSDDSASILATRRMSRREVQVREPCVGTFLFSRARSPPLC